SRGMLRLRSVMRASAGTSPARYSPGLCLRASLSRNAGTGASVGLLGLSGFGVKLRNSQFIFGTVAPHTFELRAQADHQHNSSARAANPGTHQRREKSRS